MDPVHEELERAHVDAEAVVARMLRQHRRNAEKLGCVLSLKYDAETIIAGGETLPVRTVVAQLHAIAPRARRAMTVDGELQCAQAKQAYEDLYALEDATNEVCRSVLDAVRERL